MNCCTDRRVVGLALLVCFLFLVAGHEPAAQEQAETKDVSLEWIYKKEDLEIDDPGDALPYGFRWSPKGHLLAFRQDTDQHDTILVVLDPESPDNRIVLTAAQVDQALEQLDESTDGVSPEGRLDFATATAVAPDEEEPDTENEEEKEEEEEEASIQRPSWLEEQNRLRFSYDKRRLQFDPIGYRILPDPDPELPDAEGENLERSPNDRYAAYTRDNDLYVFDFENAKELRLTDSGSETVLNGKFPWVYWEELMWRRTYRAFWWRPQADAIAFLQFDEGGISTYPITDFSDPVPTTHTQKYPKVGTKNPTVRLGIVGLSARETRWVDLGEPHEYIIFVDWLPDGSALSVQTLNRPQNRLQLYLVDPLTGRGEKVIEETRDTWVDVFEPPRFVEGRDEFLWLSERTDFRHLYLYTDRGRGSRALTSGSWVVAQPGFGGRSLFLDSERRRVYFRSTQVSPTERHVYSVSLNGGKPRRLTKDPGTHSLNFSKDGAFWIDSWSNSDVTRRIDLLDPDGRRVARLGEVLPDDYAPYRLAKPEFVTIPGEDGMTFHASLLKPFDFDPDKRYPVVAYVYGEPAGQVVQNTSRSAFDTVLVNHGFLVFRFDARGTPGRGRPWLDPIYRNQTELPMEDWRAGVAWLKGLPYVDGDRLGVWGWSGGGTMTLNLMLRTPGLFHAGAAVAAVTDKRLYDTIYTERYLGVLDDNEEGYEASSPLFAADQLEGELLIAHGISDDNVHVQNAYNLIEALSEAEKDYQLYLYPQKRHGIGGDVQFHLFERILDFFESALAPGTTSD